METGQASSDARLEDWAEAALQLLRWCGHRAQVDVRKLASPTVNESLVRAGIDSLAFLATDPDSARQRAYERIWRVQEKALDDLLRHLQASGATPIVLKSADCFRRWFDHRPIGIVGDFDIVVRRAEVQVAKRTLFTQGYMQWAYNIKSGCFVLADFKDVAWSEWRGYELFSFSRLEAFATTPHESFLFDAKKAVFRDPQGGAILRVCADVHFAPPEGHPSLTFDNEDVWRRAVQVPGCLGLSLSDADALWYTLSKYYFEVAQENKRTLRDLCYVIPILARGQIDWDVFLDCCQRHQLYGECYYFLRFLDALLGGGIVPAEVIRAIAPRNAPSKGLIRDWGWQLGRLFGFDEAMPIDLRTLRSDHGT